MKPIRVMLRLAALAGAISLAAPANAQFMEAIMSDPETMSALDELKGSILEGVECVALAGGSNCNSVSRCQRTRDQVNTYLEDPYSKASVEMLNRYLGSSDYQCRCTRRMLRDAGVKWSAWLEAAGRQPGNWAFSCEG